MQQTTVWLRHGVARAPTSPLPAQRHPGPRSGVSTLSRTRTSQEQLRTACPTAAEREAATPRSKGVRRCCGAPGGPYAASTRTRRSANRSDHSGPEVATEQLPVVTLRCFEYRSCETCCDHGQPAVRRVHQGLSDGCIQSCWAICRPGQPSSRGWWRSPTPPAKLRVAHSRAAEHWRRVRWGTVLLSTSNEYDESLIVAEPQQAIAIGGRAEAACRLVDHLREGIDW